GQTNLNQVSLRDAARDLSTHRHLNSQPGQVGNLKHRTALRHAITGHDSWRNNIRVEPTRPQTSRAYRPAAEQYAVAIRQCLLPVSIWIYVRGRLEPLATLLAPAAGSALPLRPWQAPVPLVS